LVVPSKPTLEKQRIRQVISDQAVQKKKPSKGNVAQETPMLLLVEA
jgi:hypothetical protein